MSQVPIWFERKFEFSFPVELLSNLCARLRGTPARLEEILYGRSHTILNDLFDVATSGDISQREKNK